MIETIDSPTVAPAPAPKPKPKPKNHDGEHKKKKNGGGGNSTRKYSGGGNHKSSQSSSSGGSGGTGTAAGPISATSESMGHGKPKSFVTLLTTALGIGFAVAGIAFIRQREYVEKQNAEHGNHRLKGSVKERMMTFSHLVELSSRSDSGDGSGSKKSGLLNKENKKKLVRQLSRGKSSRQKSVENEIGVDAYSRSMDSVKGILMV